MQQSLDVRRWIDGWSGEQSLLHFLHDTTLNGVEGEVEGGGLREQEKFFVDLLYALSE